MFRERLLLIKQRLLRNEHFCPPSMQITDNPGFIKVGFSIYLEGGRDPLKALYE
jgi:hypothetical protein